MSQGDDLTRYEPTIPLGGTPAAPPPPPWGASPPTAATAATAAPGAWPPPAPAGTWPPATPLPSSPPAPAWAKTAATPAIAPQPATATYPIAPSYPAQPGAWWDHSRSGYPTIPPGVPPVGPPRGPVPGWGAPQPQLPPQPPQRHRGPAMATIALLALIAIVLGLTAGITLDRALREQAGTNSQTPTNQPSGGSTTPFGNDPSSGAPSGTGNGNGNGGPVDTTADLTQDQIDEIAGKVTPGLVNINTQLGYQASAAAGTGMILTSDGKVLTNNHVIENSTTIRATVVGTGTTYEAKVLGTAPTLDVALIQLVDAKDLPTVKVDRSGDVSVGDSIVAAGNAGGRGGQPSVVSGKVTALDQTITASDESGNNAETLHNLIETSAPIQPGDSGGPLIDTDGEIIGMNTAAAASNQFQSSQSVGYAIPIDDALDVVKQIEDGKEDDVVHIGLPGIMGVQVVDGGGAALVNGVARNSPAEQAGIQAGDTITAIDGQPVTSPQSLSDRLAGKDPGEEVSVAWTDTAGQDRSAKVRLMEGPAD